MMKKTYISPTLRVGEAEIISFLAMSLQLSNESGNEEYVKEQDGEDSGGGWDIDW